ncbi:hypothetical protein MKX01_030118 [Papaver californicum]|nr:hypothetical protein MKX01_030118 [Papaver californicum]
MGILSWLTGKEAAPVTKTKESGDVKPVEKSSEISEMNGAMEVPRPADITVFEFGSADKVTLAGYCTVSEELEPCRWEILPGTTSEAPQFGVVF